MGSETGGHLLHQDIGERDLAIGSATLRLTPVHEVPGIHVSCQIKMRNTLPGLRGSIRHDSPNSAGFRLIFVWLWRTWCCCLRQARDHYRAPRILALKAIQIDT